MVKVLFIYSGTDRRELEKRVVAGIDPDTSFFSYTHVAKDARIEAEYLQINKDSYTLFGGLIRKYPLLRVLYLYFKFYRLFQSQNVIVLTSSAYFDLLLLKGFGLLRRPRWIILNLDLTILLTKVEESVVAKKSLMFKLKQSEHIVCISEAQRKFLITKGFASEQVSFVPLGVDKSFYQPIERTGEFILTIGRDIGRDFQTFLEATRLSGEKTVMICSPKNIEGLEDRIPPNLTVLFDLPYQELKKYYQRAKLFVIATKPNEFLVGSDCPGQTVILDTLAYGVPVIATEMPWFEGYFENGKHLVVVPPRDPQALSQSFNNIIRDLELLERLSKEGRKLIVEKCNSETMGKALTELILRVA